MKLAIKKIKSVSSSYGLVFELKTQKLFPKIMFLFQ